MPDVVILGDPRSTYVRTARLACEEKGIAYELKPMGPKSDELTRISPFGKIPGFQHGDFRLHETLAIVMYLESAFDAPPLLPADAQDRAIAFQWISSANDYFYDAMVRGYILQYAMPSGPDGQPNRTLIDAAMPRIRHQLAVLDHAFGNARWLAGTELSLADLFVAPMLAYLPLLPEDLPADHPNVSRFLDDMAKRPSWEKTVPPLPGR